MPHAELSIISGADHGYAKAEHFDAMLKTLSDFVLQRSVVYAHK
jgi:hypothetical protein